jgi:hypothetical protein
MWITWGKGKDEKIKPHSSLGEKKAYMLLEYLILVLCNLFFSTTIEMSMKMT